MGFDKQGSKGGNYVGGFLQMFDWNAKSRKKLFSTKSDLPEQSKQKKRCDGNLPMTRLQMLDEYEIEGVSSIKGSDYSCASSVTDEDAYGTKAPGVVARLMGLDSMPKSNVPEPYSTPLSDSLAVNSTYFRRKKFESRQDPQKMLSGSLPEVRYQVVMDPNCQKVIHRPFEKFQTEILPRKSAKSIPITHHKLLSPIKNMNFTPSKDAAQIMEAAARIIESTPPVTTKSRLPLVGSSSGPLRIRDLKEKTQAAQKPSKVFEGSLRSSESSTVKHLRGQLLSKNWNGLIDVQESTSGGKNKGKSISLALQAKANVQKRECLNLTGSRSLASHRETSEISPNQLFKSQSITQSTVKKPHIHNTSSVLRQNNQKQNCIVDRGKSPNKHISQGGKSSTKDSTPATQRSSSKPPGGNTAKISSKRWSFEAKDDKREVLTSSSEKYVCRKQSLEGNSLSERSQTAHIAQIDENENLIHESSAFGKQINWDQDNRSNGMDIVSFTFSSPMTRSGPKERSTVAGENNMLVSSDFRSKREMLSTDGMISSKFTFLGQNGKESDALSALLEQKLKELTHVVERSNQRSKTVVQHDSVPAKTVLSSSIVPQEGINKRPRAALNDLTPTPNASSSYTVTHESMNNAEMQVHLSGSGSNSLWTDAHVFRKSEKYQGMQEESANHACFIPQARISMDHRVPSPVSVLELASSVNSCNSPDTADSNCSTACGKLCSSIHAEEVSSTYSSKRVERDVELSDSASSTDAAETPAKRPEITSTVTNFEKSNQWELDYIKDILCSVGITLADYASGRAHEIIAPHQFDQMENQKRSTNDPGGLMIPQTHRRLMFDCVRECMELEWKQCAAGGFKQWIDCGLSWARKEEKIAEGIHAEISGWGATGDSLVDELLGKDMSSKHGRWLDFKTEAFEFGTQIQSQILHSLIDEVVADMLVL